MKSDKKKTMPLCPQCGHNMIEARLRTAGCDGNVFLHLNEKLSTEGTDTFSLFAWVCPNCGYIELAANIAKTARD